MSDFENVLYQIHDFERRLCAQTQYIYVVETFYISQMNPKKLSTKLHSQFNHHTLLVTPFKTSIMNVEMSLQAYLYKKYLLKSIV